MDFYEHKEFANTIGRKAGAATFGLVSIILIGLKRGFPEYWEWLALFMAGFVIYHVVSVLAFAYAVRNFPTSPPTAESPQIQAATPDPEPVAANTPEPLRTVALAAGENWIQSTNWRGLLRLVQLDNPPFSRDTLSDYVDQRFYSPRNGDTSISFPELMVKIHAAVSLNHGSAYKWSDSAPLVLHRLVTQLRSPTPREGVTGYANNGDNRSN